MLGFDRPRRGGLPIPLRARGFFRTLTPSNNYGADDSYTSAMAIARSAVTAKTRTVDAPASPDVRHLLYLSLIHI